MIAPPMSHTTNSTGMHTVADLSCLKCSSSLGWVYLKATDREQEYKEGELTEWFVLRRGEEKKTPPRKISLMGVIMGHRVGRGIR